MEQIFYCSLIFVKQEGQQSWPLLNFLIAICTPAILFKNYINLLQIYDACKVMADAQQVKVREPSS